MPAHFSGLSYPLSTSRIKWLTSKYDFPSPVSKGGSSLCPR
ncbi:hypothetical protein THOD04_60144 [Vibrio owensii]|nr:hypothetical protein THOD04_60144 [Vibrio owensii]